MKTKTFRSRGGGGNVSLDKLTSVSSTISSCSVGASAITCSGESAPSEAGRTGVHLVLASRRRRDVRHDVVCFWGRGLLGGSGLLSHLRDLHGRGRCSASRPFPRLQGRRARHTAHFSLLFSLSSSSLSSSSKTQRRNKMFSKKKRKKSGKI